MKILVFLICIFALPAAAQNEFLNRNIRGGAELYKNQCASCHGVNLEGQDDWQSPNDDGTLPAPPHDEMGHTWHHDNRLLFDYTKFGAFWPIFNRHGPNESRTSMPHEMALIDMVSVRNVPPVALVFGFAILSWFIGAKVQFPLNRTKLTLGRGWDDGWLNSTR